MEKAAIEARELEEVESFDDDDRCCEVLFFADCTFADALWPDDAEVG